MSVENRRQREKQARRDSILDAAEQVFFSKGYENSSMEEIAATAQLSRPLLYVYFKDKSAIMRGIMLRAAESIRHWFTAAIKSSSVGAMQIENIGLSYYRFSVQQPDYFDALTQATGLIHPEGTDEDTAALDQCFTGIMELMVEALNNGVTDGSLSAEQLQDPLKTAYYLRGAVHGVIMQGRALSQMGCDHPAPEELVTYTLSMLSRSMRPDANARESPQ